MKCGIFLTCSQTNSAKKIRSSAAAEERQPAICLFRRHRPANRAVLRRPGRAVRKDEQPKPDRTHRRDREGNPACFFVEDGLLVMEGKDYFILDEKAYMGYRITGFSVEQLEGKNVLKVTLSLKNLKNGFIYTSDRTTRCYCFSSDDFKKIISTDMDLNSL